MADAAARQHGVVTRAQLHAAGLGDKAIASRLRKGTLHRVHRGVYAVGHPPTSIEARWMAAVLACGEGALLSHACAAVHWELLMPLGGLIDVSVPTGGGRARHRGVRVRRRPTLARGNRARGRGGAAGGATRGLAPRDAPAAWRAGIGTNLRGIPVTTVPQTIEDLVGELEPRLVRRAIRQAELKRHPLPPRRRTRSRSDLERDFLALCRRYHLPMPPQINVKIGDNRVDFLWPEQRLVVETDDFTYHRGSVAFEDDHQRDLELRQRGFAVNRYSSLQIDLRPAAVAADVAESLRRRNRTRRT